MSEKLSTDFLVKSDVSHDEDKLKETPRVSVLDGKCHDLIKLEFFHDSVLSVSSLIG